MVVRCLIDVEESMQVSSRNVRSAQSGSCDPLFAFVCDFAGVVTSIPKPW